MMNAERDYSILGQRKNAYRGLFCNRGHNNFPFEHLSNLRVRKRVRVRVVPLT